MQIGRAWQERLTLCHTTELKTLTSAFGFGCTWSNAAALHSHQARTQPAPSNVWHDFQMSVSVTEALGQLVSIHGSLGGGYPSEGVISSFDLEQTSFCTLKISQAICET